MQQYTVFLYLQLLYMFRLVSPPITRSHNTVSTVSGINETVTATCRSRQVAVTVSQVAVTVSQVAVTVSQVAVTVSLMTDTIDRVI